MAWFNKTKAPIAPVETKKVQMPEGIWTKCKNCNEIIYTKEIERNLNVCPKCSHHSRVTARDVMDTTRVIATREALEKLQESLG